MAPSGGIKGSKLYDLQMKHTRPGHMINVKKTISQNENLPTTKNNNRNFTQFDCTT
jgi:hypothetical protein